MRFIKRSDNLQFVRCGELGHTVANCVLIPEGDAGDIVLQGEVSAAAAPAEGLDGDLQVFGKVHGIAEMPAVHGKTGIGSVQTVGAEDLGDARVRRAEFLVFTAYIEVPRASEVVLRTRSADGGELGIAVDKELYLALAPPAVTVQSLAKTANS